MIGNPPYLNVNDTWGKKDPRLAYLKIAYSSVYNDKTDLLFYFLAKAVTLTRGDVCLIVSRAFLEAFKADKLRAFLAGNTKIREIVDLRNAYVFEGVGITTAIVHLTKNRPPEKALVRRLRGDRLPPGVTAASLADGTLFESVVVDHDRFGAQPWLFTSSAVQSVIDTIDAAGTPIGEILHIGQGMQTGRNSVFGQRTAAEINSWSVPNGMRFVRARNSDIQRFLIADSGEYLLFTEPASSLADLSAGARQHLDAHRSDLEDRAAFRRGDCEWWRWTWPLHQQYMQRDKLLCPYLATGNRFALDPTERFLGLTDTTVLYDNDQPEDLRYFLGLLNSRLLTFRFRFIGKLKSGGILEYFWNSVSKLPIVRLDPADSRHERIVKLVDRMMSLQDQLQHPASPSTKAARHRQIAAADRQIDALVYSLYGITAAQREVIDSVLAPDAADLDEKPNASMSGSASPIEGEES